MARPNDRQGPAIRGLRLIEPLTLEQARRVGALAAATGVADVVDLTVAEGALRRGDIVWTSDPDDILRAGLGRLHVELVRTRAPPWW